MRTGNPVYGITLNSQTGKTLFHRAPEKSTGQTTAGKEVEEFAIVNNVLAKLEQEVISAKKLRGEAFKNHADAMGTIFMSLRRLTPDMIKTRKTHVELEKELGVDILAIFRDDQWIHEGTCLVEEDDVICIQAPTDTLKKMLHTMS